MCKKLSIILLCLLMITGCSKDKPILYSNLGNQASQNKLTNILNEADLPKENIKQFFSYVNTFNQHATPLIGDFETLEREQPDYQYFKYNSPVEISDQNDSNSLIPSFILIKNLIYTNNSGHADDSYIMFNLNLIDTIDQYSMSQEDRLKFITTFNSISVTGIKNNEISHINQIEKTFSDRDFSVKQNQKASLITLWLHSSADNRRVVSHCGVLIDSNDGLYFIEKYGCFYPYQVTKFNSRSELKTYLLTRNDLKGDENDGLPLVFENNKYLNK